MTVVNSPKEQQINNPNLNRFVTCGEPSSATAEKITIAYSTIKDNAKSSGIEVLSATSASLAATALRKKQRWLTIEDRGGGGQTNTGSHVRLY